MLNKELFYLKIFAKKIVPSETIKKIKKIKNISNKIDLYKYSIKSNLETKLAFSKKEVKKMEKTQDVFHLTTKINLLSIKIKYFYISYDKKDFKNILKMFKEIEKEIINFSKRGHKR